MENNPIDVLKAAYTQSPDNAPLRVTFTPFLTTLNTLSEAHFEAFN